MFTTSNVFGISIAPWIVWKINFYLYFISKMCKINFDEQIIQLFKSEPFWCQNILGELCCWCIGMSLNIEMSSYQYRNFHYKDKTVSWRFIFIMEIPIPEKMVFILSRGPGGCLNIHLSSYRYRDPHVKDKMVSRPSYLKHGNLHTWKNQSLYSFRRQIISTHGM